MQIILALSWLVVVNEAWAESRNSKEAGRGRYYIDDVAKYPVCLDNQDCKTDKGFVCFQYFCYPWDKKRPIEATEATSRPLTLCQRKKVCK